MKALGFIVITIAIGIAACAHRAATKVIGNSAPPTTDAGTDGAHTRMATCDNAGDVFEDCQR